MIRIGQLSEAGRFLLDQFETYLDLAHAELQALQRATMHRALWGFAGCLAGALGIAFLGVAVLIAAWDSAYRVAVAIAVPVVLLACAAVAFAFAARTPAVPGLERIRHEIQRDLATLRETLWTK